MTLQQGSRDRIKPGKPTAGATWANEKAYQFGRGQEEPLCFSEAMQPRREKEWNVRGLENSQQSSL